MCVYTMSMYTYNDHILVRVFMLYRSILNNNWKMCEDELCERR